MFLENRVLHKSANGPRSTIHNNIPIPLIDLLPTQVPTVWLLWGDHFDMGGQTSLSTIIILKYKRHNYMRQLFLYVTVYFISNSIKNWKTSLTPQSAGWKFQKQKQV